MGGRLNSERSAELPRPAGGGGASVGVAAAELVYALLSPIGLALVSAALFVCAIVMPPSFYSDVMQEPDLMFGDPQLIVFFLLCVGLFTGGVMAAVSVRPARGSFPARLSASDSYRSLAVMLAPLLLGTAVTALACVLIVRSNVLILALLAAGEGASLKGQVSGEGPLGLAGAILTGVLWWTQWRGYEIRFTGARRFILTGCQIFAFLIVVIFDTLKITRGELMPAIVGSMVLILLRKAQQGRLSRRKVVLYAGAGPLIVLGIFVAFSSLRGGNAVQRFSFDFLSYVVAPYNRLSALLLGRLHYPFAGKGFFFSAFLSANHSLNGIIPVGHYFHFPDFDTEWYSEFGATWNAGLNGLAIWSTAMGYLYSDFGWGTPLIFGGYGILYGICWGRFRSGSTVALLTYPWFLFCVLFWFGNNYLFDTKCVVLLLCGLILKAYERLGFELNGVDTAPPERLKT